MSDLYQVQGGECAAGVVEDSHDTFAFDKHRNFLVNSAGIGIYMHGRVHQQSGNAIFVGDLIHARGNRATDDLLLMEEQAKLSCGEPLTVRSSYGGLRAMAVLPAMGTANGEGDLVAYYEGGVVFFNTHAAPRETKTDGEGKVVTEGWDTKRLVDHRLNRVSATGRYAVAVLPRDHFFRSFFGLHFLSLSLGTGTFNSEQINTVSTDVEPILSADDVTLLGGTACGFWLHGNRMFATTGMSEDPAVSAAPFGRGMVVWNQAVTFTEDRTPRPAWEGLWTFDNGITGVHWLGDIGVRPVAGAFGFIASDVGQELHFASIEPEARVDHRGDEEIPIEWSFETGQFHNGTLQQTKVLKGGSAEFVFFSTLQKVRVLVRTDRQDEWIRWKEFAPTAKARTPRQSLLETVDLGMPPAACKEATWFQVRVEGLGAAEVRSIDLEITEGVNKAGRNNCVVSGAPERDYFEINSAPASSRWPS